MKNPLYEYGLFGWSYAHLLTHPWKIAEESYYHTKWFFQRGWRGWSDRDAWDLDGYLSGWMPSALDRLIDGHGHPIGMTAKGWNTRLRRMRAAFIESRKIGNMEYRTIRETRAASRRMRSGLRVFADHFMSLWD